MTLASRDPPVCPAWTVDPVVTESPDRPDPRELPAPCSLKASEDHPANQVHPVSQETEVLQDLPALDLRDHPEKKVSRVSQEDLEVLALQVQRVNRAWRWQRKVYQDPVDGTASPDCLVHRVPQVSRDSPASPVCQERKVIPDSRASDSQDPRALKVSQVSLVSQELLEDQADQEWMDSLANQDFLDLRESLALDFLALLVYREYLGLKGSRDQREIPDSQAAPVLLDEMDLMAVRELKVNLDHLEYLEPEAHLETLFRPRQESQAHLELQAR